MCVQYTFVHICVYFQSRRDDFFFSFLQMISFYISKRKKKLLKCLPGKIDFSDNSMLQNIYRIWFWALISSHTHTHSQSQQKGFNSRTVRGQPTKKRKKDKRLIKLKETKTKQKKRKLWVLEFLLKAELEGRRWKGEVYASNNNNNKKQLEIKVLRNIKKKQKKT